VTALAPDVVLLDSIAAAFHRRSTGVPVVGILHQPPGGIGHPPWRARLQARLDRRAWSRSLLLLVASESLAAELVAGGLPADRLRVVPPGCDVAAQPTARVDLRRQRGAALLCVANWLPHKGILELLAAFARLPPHVATLHMAGDEEADRSYGARVRARLAGSDLAPRVVRHGRLGAAELAALYAGADAFVLPSFRESYGTVYGEALRAGLPVVGWDAGNLPHLARHEVEGLIVATGDVEALAVALQRVAADTKLRRRLAAAARRRGDTLPTWNDTTALVFAALREVATASPREAPRQ
jgi:glycosyltransferase involved in cell wall biosynthesis